jgi:hypothetical protein
MEGVFSTLSQADVDRPDQKIPDRCGEIAQAPQKSKRSWLFWLGVILVVLSVALYGLLLVVPFLPLPASTRLALASAVVISCETMFWAGGLLLGTDLVREMRGRLSATFRAILRLKWHNRANEADSSCSGNKQHTLEPQDSPFGNIRQETDGALPGDDRLGDKDPL